MTFPTFFNVFDATDQAKDYLVAELTSGRRVRPIATFYKLDIPLFTTYLPLVDTQEQRHRTMTQLSWLNSSLKGDGCIFAFDSSIPLVTQDGDTYQQDVFLIFCSNKMGAFVQPCFYNYSQDNNSVEWVEHDIDQEQIMKTQHRVITLLGCQFFLADHTIPWESYLGYLKDQGFEFLFHPPLDENSISYAQSFLNV